MLTAVDDGSYEFNLGDIVKTILIEKSDAQLQADDNLMREAQIKHLVVVNDTDRVIGVLEFFH